MRHRPQFPPSPSASLIGAMGGATVRFSRSDLALYWGYVQGMDLRELHGRYFEGVALADVRHVRARARAIAQDLAAAVRRSARPELGALFLRDPRAIVEVAGEGDVMSAGAVGQIGTVAPSLESFRDMVDPEGFYSESELITLWVEQHGFPAERKPTAAARAEEGGWGLSRRRHASVQDRSHERRARLLARIREGLSWVESRLFAAPELHHRVDAWLPLVYARRLETAGLPTLAQLLAHINRVGRDWHGDIAGLGAGKARDIEAWIDRHAQPGRLQLLPSAQLGPHLLARQAFVTMPASAVVPLEGLCMPAGLDGAGGRFRAPREACTLAADNDLLAVRAWIRSKTSPHTQRAYTREAERLFLWCLLVRQLPASSLTVEDCELYRAFLRDPQPAQQWCAPHGTPRWSRAWRPFTGPLGRASERQALIVLKAMGAWLREQNYVIANPWAAINVAGPVRRTLDKGRSFTPAQWQRILAELDQLDDSGARPRLKFVLWFLYGTGLRVSEAVACQVQHLRTVSLSDGSSVVKLTVLGKGNKERQVPIAASILARLETYLATRGASTTSAVAETYLLNRATGSSARLPNGLMYDPLGKITADHLYRQVKAFFARVAKRCEADDAATAAQLRRASTHWLRHTFGTRLAGLTRDVVLVRDLLGHASIATTSVYLDGDEIEQRDAVERLLSA